MNIHPDARAVALEIAAACYNNSMALNIKLGELRVITGGSARSGA